MRVLSLLRTNKGLDYTFKHQKSKKKKDSPLCSLTHPHAHVEGDHSDTDVLRGLPVDIRQLQPGVVLLLPGLQGVSGCERRSYRGEETQNKISKLECELSRRGRRYSVVFTFSRVVEEEALKQLVLNRKLLCRVIRQDVFMAHVIQTWPTGKKHLKKAESFYSDGQR